MSLVTLFPSMSIANNKIDYIRQEWTVSFLKATFINNYTVYIIDYDWLIPRNLT